MFRPLDNAKIVKALLKSGVILHCKDAMKTSKPVGEETFLKVKRQGIETGLAEGPAPLTKLGARGTLRSHNISLDRN